MEHFSSRVFQESELQDYNSQKEVSPKGVLYCLVQHEQFGGSREESSGFRKSLTFSLTLIIIKMKTLRFSESGNLILLLSSE